MRGETFGLRAHQLLSFAKIAAKAEIARFLPAETSFTLAFAAYKVADVPIAPARQKDVRGERVVLK